MDADNGYWALFLQTGNPVFYTAAQKTPPPEKPPEAQNETKG